MSALADVARFRETDPDSLVRASLACPWCLHADEIERDPRLDPHDCSVLCRCPRCAEEWSVYLAPHQILRLALMSRPGARRRS
jgi:hypothetical protein